MQPTPKGIEWLQRLAAEGPLRRSKTKVGFTCMRAGWTEWAYVDREGRPISPDDARSHWGDSWMSDRATMNFKERLTDAGRAVLAAHAAQSRRPE